MKTGVCHATVRSSGSTESSPIDENTFNRLTRLIYDKAGINLGPHKKALVCARLMKRMRKLHISDYRHYLKTVLEDDSGNELVELLDAISTNVTRFMREERHFELLGPVMRQREEIGQTRFRIWSAACSTGEEPYSIAIMMKEALKATYDVKILATDISTKALAIAKKGVYPEKRVKDLPADLLAKYLTRSTENGEVTYTISDDIRNLVTFSRLNLAEPPYPLHGPLDAVFCRNVMIYFDNEVRRRLLSDMHRLLRPAGHFFVGSAECLCGILSDLDTVEPSVYVRPSSHRRGAA